MVGEQNQWLELISNINVNKSGDRRAPHKPLLLLIAISRLLLGQRELPFTEIESNLKPLLDIYAPPVKGSHQPALPYWHLQSDGLWEISETKNIPCQASGFPRMEALRKTHGHLPNSFAQALSTDKTLVNQLVQKILDGHFPQSLHEDICVAVGLDLPLQESEPIQPSPNKRRRDPAFRGKVLRAYEYRCAATGFCAALGGAFFGCEAAHVKWVAYDGPDTVENGIALEPTLHKLFDAGAWSLTDDRRILISANFTGIDQSVQRIRALHGRSLQLPQAGQQPVSLDFIRWHREKNHGGVFRQPALPL